MRNLHGHHTWEDRQFFPCGRVNYGYRMFLAILPWGMRIGPSLRNKKKRADGPLSSFDIQAHHYTARSIFCLRPEYRQGRAHPPRVLFSYSLMWRRMCYTSYRCRCAPMCSCRNRRRLLLRSLAFWPWCVRPLRSQRPQQVLRQLRRPLL